MFYAYVLESLKDNSLYYGSSANPEKRLSDKHNRGGVSYTKRKVPWVIVYQEKYTTRAEAMRREKFFKTGKGREFIRNILQNT